MTDPLYEEVEPEVWVRCLLCSETMEKVEYDLHECDVIPWEYV